jgi:5-(carboxyamino)imidazole ribonucleotide mutase
MAGRVIILMGSKSDMEHVNKITAQLDRFGIAHTARVASAHKSVRYLLGLLESYEQGSEATVYIAVAGRSNALAGMVDANSAWPVITCPPASTAYGGADIYSSLRMPSGVAPMVILEPDAAALAAAKILALQDQALRERIARYQAEMTETIIAADKSLGKA